MELHQRYRPSYCLLLNFIWNKYRYIETEIILNPPFYIFCSDPPVVLFMIYSTIASLAQIVLCRMVGLLVVNSERLCEDYDRGRDLRWGRLTYCPSIFQRFHTSRFKHKYSVLRQIVKALFIQQLWNSREYSVTALPTVLYLTGVF
jgi:hypothetical protein